MSKNEPEDLYSKYEKTVDGMVMIKLDSDLGKEIGFTSDRFDSLSYLSINEGYVYISCIEAVTPRQGHFTQLVENIRAKGWGVKVPTPFAGMVAACKKLGFEQTREFAKPFGEFVEVWVLEVE